MQKILVPTDFSDNAMKAVLYAAEIAKMNKATVYLLHVMEPVDDRIRQPFGLHEKYLEMVAGSEMEKLEAVQQAMRSNYPEVKTVTELAKGTVINSILDFAESTQVNLIVMGTKGATSLKEIFIGSVAAGTIGRSIVPVLTIPDEYVMEKPDALLFVTNHFEKNTGLLDKIVVLAKLFSATVHVAVFIDTDTADAGDYMSNSLQLDHYMSFLKKTFPEISFKGELLEGEEFEETVEKYDKENEVDIIAMITYSKNFRDKLLRKSATKKMAFHSKIPVLAIPAK